MGMKEKVILIIKAHRIKGDNQRNIILDYIKEEIIKLVEPVTLEELKEYCNNQRDDY